MKRSLFGITLGDLEQALCPLKSNVNGMRLVHILKRVTRTAGCLCFQLVKPRTALSVSKGIVLNKIPFLLIRKFSLTGEPTLTPTSEG